MDPSDLDSDILVMAYSQGCFPMPDPDSGDILFYQPQLRAIIPLDGFHCSRSLRKFMKTTDYQIRTNHNFAGVMRQCAQRPETWITDAFFRSYGELYQSGLAHSLEVYLKGTLVGGVYGVTLGSAFFAESMFHTVSNMSKVALFHLVEHLRHSNFQMLECQFLTPHLHSLGAIEIPHADYMERLSACLACKNVKF